MTSIWMRSGLYAVLKPPSNTSASLATSSSLGDVTSSSEVTSSSSAMIINADVPSGFGSPAHSSDIGEMDLEFWDLDLNNARAACAVLSSSAPPSVLTCRAYAPPTSSRVTPFLSGEFDDMSG